jgi:hypothetical protein
MSSGLTTTEGAYKMSGWSDFFDDVLKKTPFTMVHVNVRGRIRPDEHGAWLWHITMDKGSDHTKQLKAMMDMIETVGEGPVNSYEGGAARRVIHVTRKLTQEEVDRLPETVNNLLDAFKH